MYIETHDSLPEEKGTVYIIRKKTRISPKADVLALYKIGKTTKGVETRIRELERANKEEYILVREIKSNRVTLYERALHKFLEEYRCPQYLTSGGREWFRVSLAHIDAGISTINKQLKIHWSRIKVI
eukprot:TRINITY_DN543_c0_g1_i3.p3 TRINITY_DN543_c0_g1~~TRINITY_DN543_c0_g1_i3.p3  ORF type:complete len:127 (-),score=10.82 TRINITY_DN543_c0_g1_i3:94-474(-)